MYEYKHFFLLFLLFRVLSSVSLTMVDIMTHLRYNWLEATTLHAEGTWLVVLWLLHRDWQQESEILYYMIVDKSHLKGRLEYSPDILDLSETNLKPSISSTEFPVPGYLPIFQKDSSVHMHGLGVYVHEHLPLASELFLCLRIVLTTFTSKLSQLSLSISSFSFLCWQKPQLLTEHLFVINALNTFLLTTWNFLIILIRNVQLRSLTGWKLASKLSFQHKNINSNHNLLRYLLHIQPLSQTGITSSGYSKVTSPFVTGILCHHL